MKTKKKSTKLDLNFRISLMMDVIHEYWLESSFQSFTNSWLSIFKIQGKSCFQSSIPRWFGGEETTNMRCALSVEEFFSQPASFFFFKQMQSTSVAVPRHEHEAFFRVPTPFCLPCPGSQLLHSTAPLTDVWAGPTHQWLNKAAISYSSCCLMPRLPNHLSMVLF